ncbi:hypothetical protein L6164_002758 [Bauhinia variegata]|uniref:Uncharacterized protein n=1 Tax=Bauhinia variegata TaxID=167791 RepID=A0ACB9PZT2_BAUVA|nr:hypothetical protein L6164_002758 [Bauhinia variegata]
MIVTQCPKMKYFSQESVNAPTLMGIWTSPDKYGDYELHWECDLNSTIKMKARDDGDVEQQQLKKVTCLYYCFVVSAI